jgi:hypothetical protein
MRPESGARARSLPAGAERVAVDGAEGEPLGAESPEQATRSISTAVAESPTRVFTTPFTIGPSSRFPACGRTAAAG